MWFGVLTALTARLLYLGCPCYATEESVADSSTVKEARNLPPAPFGARYNVQSSSDKKAIRLLLTPECQVTRVHYPW